MSAAEAMIRGAEFATGAFVAWYSLESARRSIRRWMYDRKLERLRVLARAKGCGIDLSNLTLIQ